MDVDVAGWLGYVYVCVFVRQVGSSRPGYLKRLYIADWVAFAILNGFWLRIIRNVMNVVIPKNLLMVLIYVATDAFHEQN
jgi:hypothetical protein